MLSLCGSQPYFSTWMGTDWPLRSLWPEIPALYRHADGPQETRSGLEQHQIFEEICTMEKEGGGFVLALDTTDFSPEELSVTRVGRKLRVSGKSQKKQEDDGKGWFSYTTREFRWVFDLPEGVNPEALTCSVADDGKFYIQAAVNQASEAAERILNTDCEAVETTQTETADTQHEHTTGNTHTNPHQL